MPELALLCHLLDWEILKLADLILKLDDEPDLGRSAEVTNDQEADDLQEALSRQGLFVAADRAELVQLYRSDLHNVANVEILDPLCLIKEPENVPEVKARCSFLSSSLFLLLIWLFIWVLIEVVGNCCHTEANFGVKIWRIYVVLRIVNYIASLIIVIGAWSTVFRCITSPLNGLYFPKDFLKDW